MKINFYLDDYFVRKTTLDEVLDECAEHPFVKKLAGLPDEVTEITARWTQEAVEKKSQAERNADFILLIGVDGAWAWHVCEQAKASTN